MKKAILGIAIALVLVSGFVVFGGFQRVDQVSFNSGSWISEFLELERAENVLIACQIMVEIQSGNNARNEPGEFAESGEFGDGVTIAIVLNVLQKNDVISFSTHWRGTGNFSTEFSKFCPQSPSSN